MLSGEYAVMHGGTSVLVPVVRQFYIRESANPRPLIYSLIMKAALSLPIPEIALFEKNNGLPGLEFDASEFYGKDEYGKNVKLGLGLSATESVGTIALRMERAGLKWADHRELVFKYADQVHRRVQGGRGSGADIAACAYAKPIKFRREGTQAFIDEIYLSETYKNIPMNIYWSGSPADTRLHLDRFYNWLDTDKTAGQTIYDLIECSHDLADLWFSGDYPALKNCLEKYSQIMQNISQPANLRYELSIHRRMREWAESRGGCAKPTGAGGGDMILLIGDLPVNDLDNLIIPLTF